MRPALNQFAIDDMNEKIARSLSPNYSDSDTGGGKPMTVDPKAKESMYWVKNEEWYRVNREKGGIELTDKAPERARKSFELYCERNNIEADISDNRISADERQALEAASLEFFTDVTKTGAIKTVCPRCGNTIKVHITGNSYTVACETPGCIKEGFRGI